MKLACSPALDGWPRLARHARRQPLCLVIGAEAEVGRDQNGLAGQAGALAWSTGRDVHPGGPMCIFFLKMGVDLQFRRKKGGRCTIVF